MSSSVFYSSDLDNDDVTGLFDRIINIKFTRKNGDTFTLRSDYEAVWSGSQLVFKTCQPKPEIRVQYTQYDAVMINVDIYVTNLNILESNVGKTALDEAMINSGIDLVKANDNPDRKTNQPDDTLTSLGNAVIKAEIEMGYRGQFYNWGQHPVSSLSREDDYKAFQALEKPGATNENERMISSQAFFKKHRRCSMVVDWAAQISNPPDRVTQFHGYVGATEAGFQPFSLLTIDCAAEASATGVITKKDIIGGLDDEYHKIDEVPMAQARTEAANKGGTPFSLLIGDSRNNTYRNFFNGGKGFTLLEGYCFHMVTRRFVRSNIDVKRNSLLEQAALEYALASKYTNSIRTLDTIKEEYSQKVYAKEKPFYKKSFVMENNKIKLSAIVDPAYKEYLEKAINANLVEQYVGVRCTIKNLPEYRKLYLAIRQKLKAAAEKGEYLSWWDAAEQLGKEELSASQEFLVADQRTAKTKREEHSVDSDIYSARYYTLDLENGDLAFKDCYFYSVFGRDWILPLQNINSSVLLKDSRKRPIKYQNPTKVVDGGFGNIVPLNRAKDAKCFSGLFEVRDAYMFGVPVLCSRKASEVFHKRHENVDIVSMNFLATPQAQIEWICKTWDLEYYKLHNGGYYIYARNEDSRETASQGFVTSQSNKPIVIPAIYDITITPIRKIRMPFMAFLDPMSIVEWNSSAMIGSMISFYYQPEKGRNFFMVIKNNIDFCTVGDFNTMEMELVDTEWADKSEIPAKVITQENKDTYVQVLIFPDDQMDSWRKVYESPVCKIPYNLMENWVGDYDAETTLSLDGRVSNKQFFSLMQSWNTSLFNEAKEADTGWTWDNWFNRIDKAANLAFGKSRPAKTNFPDIINCLTSLRETKPKLERIFMHFPIMPDNIGYAKMDEYDENYVLVYQAGAWSMRLKTEFKNVKIGAE